MYTIVSLHQDGWTIQHLDTEAKAIRTWEHVIKLPQCVASSVYNGAHMERHWAKPIEPPPYLGPEFYGSKKD